MDNKLRFNYQGQTIEIDVPNIEEPQSNKMWELSYKTAKNGISDFADMTDHYKDLFKRYEKKITSTDKSISNNSANDFKQICDGVAGRPLNAGELRTIILHCRKKDPKMKINKYGHLFGKRTGKSDLMFKGAI